MPLSSSFQRGSYISSSSKSSLIHMALLIEGETHGALAGFEDHLGESGMGMHGVVNLLKGQTVLYRNSVLSNKVAGFGSEDLGTDDYMVKPIDLDELFLRIGALLRRAKIASSRSLAVGSFSMDMDEHIAMLGDEEINLTNREFNILYKLLSYPKKTFTRQQLMDEFWDADTETAPRAVDVYMTKLRSKLADCEDFEIKTVHGLGYKAVIK